eukprot:2985828-Amphidinium_carterae.1
MASIRVRGEAVESWMRASGKAWIWVDTLKELRSRFDILFLKPQPETSAAMGLILAKLQAHHGVARILNIRGE